MMYGEQCGHRRRPHPVGTVVVVVVPWDDMLCLSRFFEVLPAPECRQTERKSRRNNQRKAEHKYCH